MITSTTSLFFPRISVKVFEKSEFYNTELQKNKSFIVFFYYKIINLAVPFSFFKCKKDF